MQKSGLHELAHISLDVSRAQFLPELLTNAIDDLLSWHNRLKPSEKENGLWRSDQPTPTVGSEMPKAEVTRCGVALASGEAAFPRIVNESRWARCGGESCGIPLLAKYARNGAPGVVRDGMTK